MQDYSPDYCLALLALPVDNPQRARGHALLRKLLWELPDELSPLGGADKDDFLAAARPLLTPREHVRTNTQGQHRAVCGIVWLQCMPARAAAPARTCCTVGYLCACGTHPLSRMCDVAPQLDLHKAAPKGALGLAQQQVHAEALVAVAFQHRQPLMLLQAAAAFKRLEQAAAQVSAGRPAAPCCHMAASVPPCIYCDHAQAWWGESSICFPAKRGSALCGQEACKACHKAHPHPDTTCALPCALHPHRRLMAWTCV